MHGGGCGGEGRAMGCGSGGVLVGGSYSVTGAGEGGCLSCTTGLGCQGGGMHGHGDHPCLGEQEESGAQAFREHV